MKFPGCVDPFAHNGARRRQGWQAARRAGQALAISVAMMLGLAAAGNAAAHGTSGRNDPAGAGAVPPASDNGWYVAPTLGGYYNDAGRDTRSRQIYYGLGVGRFLSPNLAIDLFLDHTRRDTNAGGSWYSDNLGAAARYHFGRRNTWRPYLLAGLMASHHRGQGESGWSPAAELGGGIAVMTTDRLDIRVEGGYRYDHDDRSRAGQGGYGDWFVGLGLVSWFGAPPPASAPVHAAKVADCAVLDSDLDDVNDCDDRCPDTLRAIVGPDGCPLQERQQVVIDLQGINFKFDRPKQGEADISPSLAEPSDDSVAVLDQAVDILRRYPQMRVAVAGYTDAVGSDAYNQGLSERRARIVYDYLVGHGIDAARLDGPVGHGKNDPVADNATDDGRARNRRTELQVQPQG